jgi:hypothetical protein
MQPRKKKMRPRRRTRTSRFKFSLYGNELFTLSCVLLIEGMCHEYSESLTGAHGL